ASYTTRDANLITAQTSAPPTSPLPPRRTCLLAPGKNSAAPKRTFRSALVSADGGPKGKMIEGRSGGSWRGTRRELWAPPDSGSAHRRIAGLYRVPMLDPEPFTAPPSHSFPPPLPPRRTCLLAPGLHSALPIRTFSSALVSADGGPKG